MRRRNAPEIEWPSGLAVCVTSEWPTPSEPDLAPFLAWQQWVDARIEFLQGHGYSDVDAQFIAASGDLPRELCTRVPYSGERKERM